MSAGRPGRRDGARPGAAVLCACLSLAAGARRSAAGGLDLDLVGARSIARAGATTVSGDGGAALAGNPAGLARSSGFRVQLGAALHDDDADFRAPDAAERDSPTVSDRSSPAPVAGAAVQGPLGPIVLGAALVELGHLDRELPSPALGQMDADVVRLFPHRYAGLELHYRRRAAVFGAAVRLGDWLGLGAAVGGADVQLAERRRIWAGFAGRDELGAPARDLDLAVDGRDRVVPFASAGALVAPPSLPLELAASLSWSADASLDGGAALTRTSGAMYPAPMPVGPPGAEVRLAMPTTLRAGLRYLGDRLLVEVGGDLSWFRGARAVPIWRTRGLAVVDDTGTTAPIARLPSLAAQRDHGAVRGAVDVEVVPGLLWLTAGYAYASAGTGRPHVSPGFGDLGGHTVALGGEGTWNQITFTLGVARRFAPSITVSPDETDVLMENPFPGGGTAVAAAGRHGGAHDCVGLTVEVAWE